jgi:hypothetical protein
MRGCGDWWCGVRYSILNMMEIMFVSRNFYHVMYVGLLTKYVLIDLVLLRLLSLFSLFCCSRRLCQLQMLGFIYG